jgi:hypothetical protein
VSTASTNDSTPQGNSFSCDSCEATFTVSSDCEFDDVVGFCPYCGAEVDEADDEDMEELT